MELLKQYFKLQKEIYDYFGFEEGWVVIPLEDSTNYFWHLGLDSEGGGGTVYYAEKKQNLFDGEGYSSAIFTYVGVEKYVYRAADYTMILIDTQTDGNKFCSVFDNSKEIKEKL